MKQMVFSFLCLLLVSLTAAASINVYDFEDEQKRAQFDELIQELRCPKCQNQNIADSDAGVAKLIKDRVYKLVQEGQGKQQITDHMIDRYGEFVTYRPPVKKTTALLWFGPVIFLVFAVGVLIFFVKTNKKSPQALSQAEQSKVQDLLKQYGSDDDQSKSQ